jgi:hypothetical protein
VLAEPPIAESGRKCRVLCGLPGRTSLADRAARRGTEFGQSLAVRPVILILEKRREIATALEEVVKSARYAAVVRSYVDSLADLGATPSAIIVRITFEGVGEPTHAAIRHLPPNRPPVIAIAWEDAEIDEALRLKCDIVLKAPDDVGRLGAALTSVVNG